MYTIKHIAAVLHAASKFADEAVVIKQLLTDSRRIIFADTTLFFALVTQRRNAHIFIGELYERGVHNFVVLNNFDAAAYPKANFIFVDDTRTALQHLAAFHRKQFTYPVIAITGSNGKTIVKEWLYQMLSPEYAIVRSPRSYNSQTGVPLSVWQMSNQFNLGIFEAGISQPGEMQPLADIIKPNIGIFTNIGNAHDENFTSVQQKIKEKCKLFTGCEKVIVNGDNTEVLNILSAESKAEFFTWGKSKTNQVRIISQQKNESTTLMDVDYNNATFKLIIPFTDEASIQNATTCFVTLLYFKIPINTIYERLQLLQSVDMRLQLIPAINNSALINDSYSFDIASFSVALDFMQQQNQFTQKTIILSDMPGADTKSAYAELIFMLKAHGVKRAIVIGEYWKTYYTFLKDSIDEVEHFASTATFLNKFSTNHFRNELILLKGARKFSFENIAAVLQQKVHRTVMEINLTAMVNNLNAYRKILKPGVKIMAMVKASGYGSGSAEIANVLQFHKTDYLAVAYADEGVELRKANIRLPIMVMNMDEEAFEGMIQFNLEPEIYSLHIFKSFDIYLDKQGLQFYPVHIKLDTGMHRLGFGLHEIDELISLLKTSNRMVVRSAFSHLAASEDANEDAFTLLQAERFEEACSQIEAAISYPFIKHLANSAASFRLPQLQFDMVRLGIGLFGIDTTGKQQLPLQPVATLKTTVAQIRKIKNGDTVGYNRTGKINEDAVIATLRIGYADGLRRILSNGNGSVFIHEKRAPVIGLIAMDMTMIDVTQIPNVNENDEAEIFGNHISVAEVAKNCNTIPYEILTGISQRVKRVYVEE